MHIDVNLSLVINTIGHWLVHKTVQTPPLESTISCVINCACSLDIPYVHVIVNELSSNLHVQNGRLGGSWTLLATGWLTSQRQSLTVHLYR